MYSVDRGLGAKLLTNYMYTSNSLSSSLYKSSLVHINFIYIQTLGQIRKISVQIATFKKTCSWIIELRKKNSNFISFILTQWILNSVEKLSVNYCYSVDKSSYVFPNEIWRHIVFSFIVCLSVCLSVRHAFVSALYLLNPL